MKLRGGKEGRRRAKSGNCCVLLQEIDCWSGARVNWDYLISRSGGNFACKNGDVLGG